MNRRDAVPVTRVLFFGRPPGLERGGRCRTSEQHNTVVIGGGQAGLAVGHFLKARGRDFVILDAGERIGDGWRGRWDSLRLFAPASLDGLPGWPSRRRASYPTAGEMADYLEAYAAERELPVRNGVVCHQPHHGDGQYVVGAGDACFVAENVVVAACSGAHASRSAPANSTPASRRPTQATPGTPGVNPAQRRTRARGRSQPLRLRHRPRGRGSRPRRRSLRAGHRTAAGAGGDPARQVALPNAVPGRHTRAHGGHPVGRRMRPHIRHGGAPLLRYRRKELAAAGVDRVLARTCGVEAGRPLLDDGQVLNVRNVIWCTGFRPDTPGSACRSRSARTGTRSSTAASWPDRQGCTLSESYPFQHSFASMLIGGMGRDAERVARHIATERAPSAEVARRRTTAASQRVAS